MVDNVIEIENLTKNYGEGRGIFNIDLSVKKGEMFGFVGTNGSGKTTTIRHIMGFIKQDSGTCKVLGLDAWTSTTEIKRHVSYVPGEIAFPDLKSGTDFLNVQAELLGLQDMTRAHEIIEKLSLDTGGRPKTMSKGMKQKMAIVAALMADKDIIILDEPTTGLDPLMRLEFVDIIMQQKKLGKTIFMSSHMYSELEATCDRVALIKDGHIVDIADMNKIRDQNKKTYKIEFLKEKEYIEFKTLGYKIIRDQSHFFQPTIEINQSELSELFKKLSKYKLKFITEIKYDLQRHFKEVLNKIKEKEDDSDDKRLKDEKI